MSSIGKGSYLYAAYGDYLLDNCELSRADSGIYLFGAPYSNPDAIVFSTVPLVSYGDANGDGASSLIDVVRVLKAMTGMNIELDRAAADINRDASLSVADVLKILNLTLEN